MASRPKLTISTTHDHLFDEFSKRYVSRKIIGIEKASIIHLAYDNIKRMNVVIKINTDVSAFHHYINEINILKHLKHDNIVKLLDSFIDERNQKVYIVLEYIDGMDMYNFLSIRKRLTETQVIIFLKKILETIQYCHSNGVCHRDIKCENIMVTSSGDIKIIDFGYSKFDPSNEFKMSRLCGSATYIAPEILSDKITFYNQKCDSWSIGITLYIMLFGYEPFHAETDKETIKNILNNDLVIPKSRYVDRNILDLLINLLNKDPSKRISIKDGLTYLIF